jgi:hypothetical protein
VNGPSLEHRTPHDVPGHEREQEARSVRGDRPVVGGQPQTCPIQVEDGRVVGLADTRGAPDHGVQHGLEIRRRGADDPQDLGRGRLLLERFGEVAVLGLQLLEEADVLDGDDGLIGESLEEGDLLVGERSRLRAPDRNGPDGLTFPQERDR